MKKLTTLLICLTTLFMASCTSTPEPIKAVIVAGGCCHDYKSQKKIIADGLAERINITCDVIHEQDAKKMKEALSKKGWADKYDLVIYNFCHAHESDKEFIESIAKIHYEGKAAIALHCSMHTYHWKIKGETKAWTEMLGVTSPNHGPKSKIEVTPYRNSTPCHERFSC